MLNPLAEVGAICKQRPARLFVSDGVSPSALSDRYGGVQYRFCVQLSSKAIGSYPGLFLCRWTEKNISNG